RPRSSTSTSRCTPWRSPRAARSSIRAPRTRSSGTSTAGATACTPAPTCPRTRGPAGRPTPRGRATSCAAPARSSCASARAAPASSPRASPCEPRLRVLPRGVARYAIGDLQGCMASLDRLLGLIDFKPHIDQLWLVGDLVNRGPRSLDVLRWARELGPSVTCVLGNHDLHLLARAAGAAGPKRLDTLDEVLNAP